MKTRAHRSRQIPGTWRAQPVSDVVPRERSDEALSKHFTNQILPLACAFCGVFLLFMWVKGWDGSMRGSAAPILAEVPRDVNDPFGITRRDARFLTTYREPPPKKPEPPPPAAKALDGIDAKLIEKSMRFYRLRCASCHGDSGGGDGLAASMIQPKPRSFSDRAWQDSVTNEQIQTVLIKGGPALGRSAMMPASPDLKSKQELTETLVQLLRSFGESSGIAQ